MKENNIYNTPVYAYKIRKMDRKLLENLCSYFAEGSSLYEDPGMTKEELIAEKGVYYRLYTGAFEME